MTYDIVCFFFLKKEKNLIKIYSEIMRILWLQTAST